MSRIQSRGSLNRKRRSPALQPLSQLQPDRFIFLDFESFMDGPPLLSGTLIDGIFEQTVLDNRLKPAAEAKEMPSCSLRGHAQELVGRAERENRLICGYSNKELHDLESVLGRSCKKLYFNALPLAKKWRRRFYPHIEERVRQTRERLRRRNAFLNGHGNRLLDFAEIMNVAPPRDYGRGCEAARLRHVIGQLDRRHEYQRLTPVAKAKWTKALKHNKFDVVALECLVRRIARDFAEA